MEELLQKMNEYWDTHEATIDDDGMKFFDESADYDKSGELIRLMWEHLFIGSHWNYETAELLRNNGYSLRVFDHDSFGILMAGVGKDGKWISIG